VRRLSLRTRLLLGVVLLAALGLAVADVATYRSLSSYLVQQVDQNLDQVHPQVELALLHSTGPIPPSVYGDCVQVRHLNGSVIPPTLCVPLGGFGYAAGGGAHFPSHVSLPDRPNTPDGDRVTYFTAGSYRVRAAIEGQRPDRILLIGQWLGPEDSTLHRLFLTELFVTLAVLAALAGLALWIIHLGLKPLRAIEATAVAITAGDLSQRVERADGETEVGRVGGALNAMLDRIEASDRRLRRFVGDASHELRTPLASVRAYAELFERGAATRPADLERAMAGITRESERMSVLVDDLLLLARLDEGRPLEREAVALDAIVAEAVDAAQVVDPERSYELDAEPAVVTGDRDRLRQIVDNLLANVRAHTPAGTAVRISVRSVGADAVLEVADSGPGLGSDDAARAFERFYRADESRARASGGVGLGLSIVAAVAQAHGGTVDVRSTPGGGATFRVVIPLAQA